MNLQWSIWLLPLSLLSMSGLLVAGRVRLDASVLAPVQREADRNGVPLHAQVAFPARPSDTAASQQPTAPRERVTVECFSEPSGADILIDGEFVGNTPSILKVPTGNHRLEMQLSNHRPYSQPLNLAPGAGILTIRVTLEKKD